MLHLSESLVPKVQTPAVSQWQSKALYSGLYARISPNENQRLTFSDLKHILKIMPHTCTTYKLDGIPRDINEISVLFLKESAQDLGRNDKIGHVVLVIIKKTAEQKYFVELFDSTNKRISDSVRKQLDQKLPSGSHVTVHHVPVQNQGATNDTDCGYFALAFATHIFLGLREELDTVVFDISEMRRHLTKCCKKSALTEFPVVWNENNQKLRVTGRKSIDDYSWSKA